MKCKKCKCDFEPRYFLQKWCLETTECIAAHVEYSKLQTEKGWRKRKTVIKDSLKTHSDWSKELQDEINLIARLIDKDQPCISCQKSTGSQRHGGHRWRTSTYPEIRFHLDNVASQCCYCNDQLSGNSDGYDIGLNQFYGADYFNWVKEGIRKAYPVLKLTIPELIEAKARAKKIVKGLKTIDLTYPPEVRILLRLKYNTRLGIYN